MSAEFKREDRYIVFKLSDVERYLTAADRTYLEMMKNEIDAGRDCANTPPFKGLIVESDWPEYEPTWRAVEARVTGAQPAPSFADAYQGAMEDVAIWKKRALEAEDLNRKFVAEINGPAYMGEPAQPAPSALAEAIIADMQAQHDSELITENDSGEALIRLDGAIAAVEDNFALAQPAPIIHEGVMEIIAGLVREVERNTCTHEETHRGGFIWEVCDMCGARWAYDEGGKPEFKWPEVVEKARAMLAAAPEANP